MQYTPKQAALTTHGPLDEIARFFQSCLSPCGAAENPRLPGNRGLWTTRHAGLGTCNIGLMLKIYGTSGSRAVRTLWAAEECGVEFEHIPTHFIGEAQEKDYLTLNPNGKVPTLVDDDLVLFESMAINLYLAENYGGMLWPQTKIDRARALQWSVWGVAEVENHTIPIVWELMFKKNESERDMATVDKHREALGRPLRMLNRHLSQSTYLLSNDFTIADVNVAGTVSLAQIDWSNYPEIERWQSDCRARPAFQRAQARA